MVPVCECFVLPRFASPLCISMKCYLRRAFDRWYLSFFFALFFLFSFLRPVKNGSIHVNVSTHTDPSDRRLGSSRVRCLPVCLPAPLTRWAAALTSWFIQAIGGSVAVWRVSRSKAKEKVAKLEDEESIRSVDMICSSVPQNPLHKFQKKNPPFIRPF